MTEITPFILFRSFVANGACAGGSCDECKKMYGFEIGCPACNIDDGGDEIPSQMKRDFAKILYDRMNKYIEYKKFPPFKSEPTIDDIINLIGGVIEP